MTTAADPGGTILVVDDAPANLAVLVEYLTGQGYTVLVARDGESALEQARYARPDLILLDVLMPGLNGYETCRRFKAGAETAEIPIIFITALADTGEKVRGFGVGAVDYMTKPFQQDEVLARVRTHLALRRLQRDLQSANERLEQRVAERTAELAQALAEVERLKDRLQAENLYLQEEIRVGHNFGEILGQSPELRKVLHQIEQVATTDATVLILGETGTGKELVARAIHHLSPRRGRALVKLNCAALPATLIESELFGHEKGAFTGALARKIGRFELADGGSLFLDEVGDLPLELQAKLLRVLQESEFERVGNSHSIKVDVRVLAATNRDLKEAVAGGRFREDLYYRLHVFPIALPPLRQRRDDIPLLVRHFMDKHGKKLGRAVTGVPVKAMDALCAYGWPGNIRELENVIERALILSSGTTLLLDDLVDLHPAASADVSATKPTGLTLEEAERHHISAMLEETYWQIEGRDGAAARLNINASTLRSRMRRLGIERPQAAGAAGVRRT